MRPILSPGKLAPNDFNNSLMGANFPQPDPKPGPRLPGISEKRISERKLGIFVKYCQNRDSKFSKIPSLKKSKFQAQTCSKEEKWRIRFEIFRRTRTVFARNSENRLRLGGSAEEAGRANLAGGADKKCLQHQAGSKIPRSKLENSSSRSPKDGKEAPDSNHGLLTWKTASTKPDNVLISRTKPTTLTSADTMVMLPPRRWILTTLINSLRTVVKTTCSVG